MNDVASGHTRVACVHGAQTKFALIWRDSSLRFPGTKRRNCDPDTYWFAPKSSTKGRSIDDPISVVVSLSVQVGGRFCSLQPSVPQKASEVAVSIHSMLRFAVWVVTPTLMCACAGQPVVDMDGLASSSKTKGGAGNQTSVDPSSKGGSTVQITTGQAGNSVNGVLCKTTCEAKECGPISNQCGGFVECGGCTAPETCGGSGIPSICGASNPICIATSCQALGATCGMQSDGCGGILDCWSEAAKASGTEPTCEAAGQLCVNGTCTATVPPCTKLTCADYAGNPSLCGPVSDGCSGVLDCGFTCGIGEGCIDSKCTKLCTPITCAAALATLAAGYCDVIPDGCGGIIPNCSTTCTGDESCGADATKPGLCGKGTVTTCTPKTVADCGTTCGAMSDGCNGIVQCPTTCPEGQTCGGDSTKPGQCGTPTSVCQKTTCTAQGATCGQIPDLCQGLLNCGTCPDGKVCSSSNTCITSTPTCTPKTQAEVCTGICGQQSDGCSGSVDCGGCPAGETCGGGGASKCGSGSTCTPKSQSEICSYADACGYQSDGCSGSVNCGGCTWPKTCVGTKGVCSMPNIPGCDKLCPFIDTTCTTSGKMPTRLTGKVYAPNGTTPLYNALVYVPNGTLPSITTGATCERCEDENLGSPIAAALTTADGSFTLNNVPAGTSFPLVIKMGKWRRVVTVPAVDRCASVALTADQTRLPRSKTDADASNVQYVNIPRFAVVSGLVDAMECVLRKIGVDDSEFTRPSQNGRIHMYRAPVNYDRNGNPSNGGGGVMGCVNFKTGSTTQCASAKDADVVQDKLADLFASSKLNQYDIAVFDCEGSANDHDSYDATLLNWANAGGRVFASHYSYKYLNDNGTFANSATWGGTASGDNTTTGIIDKSDPVKNPKGVALNAWMGNVNAWSPTYGDGYISITDPRYYVTAVKTGSERFIYTDNDVRIGGTQLCKADSVQQYAFNTPFGAAASSICGRVLYSAFHVAGASGIADKVFPSYCSTGALTAQEKVLMFMLFDLSACVSVGDPPQPPGCTKNTCAGLGATCGSLSDGCGGLLECGTCVAPESCGGGGVPNHCGNNCTRTTCGAQGANCGMIADGCGGILECGTCTSPATCGGSGTPNVCGTPVCTPKSCAASGAQCGFISDGCGDVVDCGNCVAPAVCGGGGTPNVCSTGTCTPSGNCGTAKCGFVSDGCGDFVSCGTCPTGFTCVSGVCTGTTCTKRTCASVGASCGFIGDGCGGVLDCGVCKVPQVCGGGGVASQCGGDCTPRKCSDVGAGCGAISDDCGGIVECGVCVAPATCGGGGVANQCGTGTCAPRNCTQADAECGSVGDGCGGVLSCGTCKAPLTCGGAGIANHCGTGGCIPLTCALQGANCGPVADGCGNLLDCGTCPVGETCGGGGIPSQCGKTVSW